jgi:hypothetical protein
MNEILNPPNPQELKDEGGRMVDERNHIILYPSYFQEGGDWFSPLAKGESEGI